MHIYCCPDVAAASLLFAFFKYNSFEALCSLQIIIQPQWGQLGRLNSVCLSLALTTTYQQKLASNRVLKDLNRLLWSLAFFLPHSVCPGRSIGRALGMGLLPLLDLPGGLLSAALCTLVLAFSRASTPAGAQPWHSFALPCVWIMSLDLHVKDTDTPKVLGIFTKEAEALDHFNSLCLCYNCRNRQSEADTFNLYPRPCMYLGLKRMSSLALARLSWWVISKMVLSFSSTMTVPWPLHCLNCKFEEVLVSDHHQGYQYRGTD